MAAYRFSGELLRAARDAARETNDETGQAVDRSGSAITLYKLGYRTPPIEVLIALAAHFDVPVESFFERVDASEAVAQ
jgi:transcriptional regulator with XRE-family HTH domain